MKAAQSPKLSPPLSTVDNSSLATVSISERAEVSITFGPKIPADLARAIRDLFTKSSETSNRDKLGVQGHIRVHVEAKKNGDPEFSSQGDTLLIKVAPSLQLFSKFIIRRCSSEPSYRSPKDRAASVIFEELAGWGKEGFASKPSETLSAMLAEAGEKVRSNEYRGRSSKNSMPRSAPILSVALPGTSKGSPAVPLQLYNLARFRDDASVVGSVNERAKIASRIKPFRSFALIDGQLDRERAKEWGSQLSIAAVSAIASYFVTSDDSGLRKVLALNREIQDYIHFSNISSVREPSFRVTREQLLNYREALECIEKTVRRNPFIATCNIAEAILGAPLGASKALDSFLTVTKEAIAIRLSLIDDVTHKSHLRSQDAVTTRSGVPEWFPDVVAASTAPSGEDLRPYKRGLGNLAENLLCFALSKDEDERAKFAQMFTVFVDTEADNATEKAAERAQDGLERNESVEIVANCLWDMAAWARGEFQYANAPALHRADRGVVEVARRFIYALAHDSYLTMFEAHPEDSVHSVLKDLAAMKSCLKAHRSLPSEDNQEHFGRMMEVVGEQQALIKIRALTEGGLHVEAGTNGNDSQLQQNTMTPRLELVLNKRAIIVGGRGVARLLSTPLSVLETHRGELIGLCESLLEKVKVVETTGALSTCLNCLEPVAILLEKLNEVELRKKVMATSEGLQSTLFDVTRQINKGLDDRFAIACVKRELRLWRPGQLFSGTKSSIRLRGNFRSSP